MPAATPNPETLEDLFDQVNSGNDEKSKLLALSKAKSFIMNKMSSEMIRESFINESANFESLFSLDIWKDKLEDGAMINFIEPYEIVEKIFGNFVTLIDLISNFKEQIQFLINQNKDEKVKHICVSNMIKLTKSLKIEDFEEFPDPCGKITEFETSLKQILPNFVHQIPELTVSYSELLAQLFCHLTTHLNKLESTLIEKHHNITAVFSSTVFDDNPELTHEFQRVKKINKTVQLRIMDIFIKLAAISKDHLINISEPIYKLDANIKELLDSSDILAKLNVIEILSNLGITFHGYEYLQHKGHLKTLLDDLINSDFNPFGSFTEAAIMKLFSHIAKTMPEKIEENHPEYFKLLFHYSSLEDLLKNETQINLSIQTFIYLFESNIVKKLICETHKIEFETLLCRLVFILRNIIDEQMKTDCLICISEIISADPTLLHVEHNETKWLHSPWIESMSDLTEWFYKKLTIECSHDALFKLCLGLAKAPFLSTRLAAQLFFKALAQTKWGLSLLFTETNSVKKTEFIDYLLVRTYDNEKEGQDSKFDLIKLICANFKLNNDLFSLIGEGNLEGLEEYIKLGAFYTPAPLKVATESN